MPRLSPFPAIAPFPTSETQATSEFRGPFGQVFRDPDVPMNAYMLVNCQEAFVIGEVVVINAAGEASQITNNSFGTVGVIVATVSGSDTAAYAQVEGENASTILTSGVTTAGLLFAPATSDGGYLDILTSAEGNVVIGARCTVAPSTATTPFTSDTQASGTCGVGTVFFVRGGAFVTGVANNLGTVS